MPFLYDANVASELRRARQPGCHAAFAAWAAKTDLSQSYLSVVTIHEMARGVMLTERKDPARGRAYRAWLDVLLGAFHGRILDLTLDAAIAAASYHVLNSAPLADALIAGTAAVNGLTVVTRNVADFARFGVPVLNPWECVGPAN